jgi:hypothetical protein
MKKLDCMTRRILLHVDRALRTRTGGHLQRDLEVCKFTSNKLPSSRPDLPGPEGGAGPPPLRAYRNAQRRRRRSVFKS